MGLLSMLIGASVVLSALLLIPTLESPADVVKWATASLFFTALDAAITLAIVVVSPDFQRRYTSMRPPGNSLFYFVPFLVVHIVLGGIGIALLIRNSNSLLQSSSSQSPAPDPFERFWFSIFLFSVIISWIKGAAMAFYSVFGLISSFSSPYQQYALER